MFSALFAVKSFTARVAKIYANFAKRIIKISPLLILRVLGGLRVLGFSILSLVVCDLRF